MRSRLHPPISAAILLHTKASSFIRSGSAHPNHNPVRHATEPPHSPLACSPQYESMRAVLCFRRATRCPNPNNRHAALIRSGVRAA
eukprot:576606-Prymnesium_polylepis.1